ncbi:MAG: hypothetical protein Q4E62_03165 [Sutterellaceae bacterium]|nr:hypothetical protein [Sutterellaceae bacterium]
MNNPVKLISYNEALVALEASKIIKNHGEGVFELEHPELGHVALTVNNWGDKQMICLLREEHERSKRVESVD